jgi:hypothetical protein
MFLACLLRRRQFKQMPADSASVASAPKNEESGSAKPATPLRIRIPSGVQCSSCEDFKVLPVVANRTPSPWNCGSCLGQ